MCTRSAMRGIRFILAALAITGVWLLLVAEGEPMLGAVTIRATAIELTSSVMHWTGVSRLARRSRLARAGILVYHDPTPETVERHLAALSKHHAFVSLDDVVDALRAKRWDDIPPQSLAVTIDDGFRGNAALADTFAAYDVVPTVFVCTRIVGTERPFWWTRPGIDVEALKRVPNAERVAVLERMGDARQPRQALSMDELAMLSRNWNMGAHTATHPILPRCTDQEAREEVVASKHEVETLVGVTCSHFAYPNGSFGDREVALVREAGYLSARTTTAGWVRDETDPFRLPIVPMPDSASPNRALAQVTMVTLAPSLFGRFGSDSLGTSRRRDSTIDTCSSARAERPPALLKV